MFAWKSNKVNFCTCENWHNQLLFTLVPKTFTLTKTFKIFTPYTSITIVNANLKSILFKFFITFTYSVRGYEFILERFCVHEEACQHPAAKRVTVAHCSTCDTDGCNDAINYCSTILLIFLSSFVSMRSLNWNNNIDVILKMQ